MLNEATPSPFSASEEAILFDALLTHGLSRDHLAHAINDPHLSTLDILAFIDQPHIQQALAQLRRAHALAATLRHARARFTAIETLEHVCTTDPNPTNRRRAATTLLTGRKPARQQGLGRAPRPTSPSQREGAGGWVRATSALENLPEEQPPHDHDAELAPPLAPGQAGSQHPAMDSVNSHRPSHESPRCTALAPSEHPARVPVSSRGQSDESSRSAVHGQPSAIGLHPARVQVTENANPALLERTTHDRAPASINPRVHSLIASAGAPLSHPPHAPP